MKYESYIRIIDIHAHLLPGIDDGAADLTETKELITLAEQVGIEAVIATPHYSRRRAEADVHRKIDNLINVVYNNSNDGFRIYAGHETIWHEELPERIAAGYALTLAGSRYVLLEYDGDPGYGEVLRSVRNLMSYGYVPILAHAERVASLRKEDRLEELRGMNVLIQMNFESLIGGIFDKDVRWCRNAVRSGYVDFLATDMHRPSYRPPDIGKALEWLKKSLDITEIERMTYVNPLHIIHDEAIN